MATHVSETQSTTKTSEVEEEEEQQTFLQLLIEKIAGVFGLVRRIIRILFVITLVVACIIALGTILSTKDESQWESQNPNDMGSELRSIEITPEELDAYYWLMNVADTLQYDGMTWEGENAKDFAKPYFPENYEADVKSVTFTHDPASVRIQYITSGGNKEIHMEFRRGHINKTIWLYHGFTENDFPGMILWYAYGKFHTGYPCYIYSRDVGDYSLAGNLLIRKQVIKWKMFGRVTNFIDRLNRFISSS